MRERIQAARTRILLSRQTRWWASLVMRLDPVEDPTVETASTNGKLIRLNPGFAAGLTDSELDFLLVHEALHCGFLHHLRRGDREGGRWNVACDHAINLILRAAGLTMPEGGAADPQFEGLSAEEIYRLLPEGGDRSPFGEVEDGDATAPPHEARAWQEGLVDAMHAAARAGQLPGSIEKTITEAITPSAPWQELLSQFVERCAGQDDYSWARLSRRGLSLGLLLPGTYASQCRPLAICIDTSGSMSEALLGRVVAEARAAISAVRPRETLILSADTRVTSTTLLSPEEDWVPHLSGGGGTDFQDALTTAAQFDPACVIYLTDLDGTFGQDPEVPVLWVTPKGTTVVPPFGTVITIEEN